MKLSARNQLKGKIIEVKKGATTTHVRIDIGGHDHCFHHERIRLRTPARRSVRCDLRANHLFRCAICRR